MLLVKVPTVQPIYFDRGSVTVGFDGRNTFASTVPGKSNKYFQKWVRIEATFPAFKLASGESTTSCTRTFGKGLVDSIQDFGNSSLGNCKLAKMARPACLTAE